MTYYSNVDWLNSNSNRNYPIFEGATLSNGQVTIPKSFIVDLILSGTDESLIYKFSYVEVTSQAIQVGVADSSGVFHGVFNIPTNIMVPYISQFFQHVSESSVRGKAVFSKQGILELSKLEKKRYFFGYSSTRIEPCALVPKANMSNVVTSISKYGDTKNSLTGDVVFVEGNGIAIQTIPSLNALEFSASKVYNTKCPEDVQKLSRCQSCIKYINGIPPRDDGNFDIVGTEFIEVINDPSNNKIIVRFTGQVDCCCTACDKIEQINNQVQQMQNSVNTLSGIVKNAIP